MGVALVVHKQGSSGCTFHASAVHYRYPRHTWEVCARKCFFLPQRKSTCFLGTVEWGNIDRLFNFPIILKIVPKRVLMFFFT